LEPGRALGSCPPLKEVTLIFASSAVRELPIPPAAHIGCERRHFRRKGIGWSSGKRNSGLQPWCSREDLPGKSLLLLQLPTEKNEPKSATLPPFS
jgi:hypothetical protein